MKFKSYISSIKTLVPVLGLAFVLLISPCKVRNFIQAELGTPQTEIANKGKTNIDNTTCISSDIATSSLAKINFSSQVFFTTTFDLTSSLTTFSKSYLQPQQAQVYSATAIPLYILYQNFKDYL